MPFRDTVTEPSPAIRELRSAVASAWKPKRVGSLAAHCESTVKLSPTWEAGRGSYDLKANPFWRQILDDMIDPDVREISVCKSTRVGGTLALIAAVLGLSELDPGPAMVVTPDEPSGIELRDRIYDTALASPSYSSKVPPERAWNTRAIDLQTNQVFMAWAGSSQRLRGRTCRRVFLSEIDVYGSSMRGGGDPIRAAGERVKRSFYNLRYYESSPDGENSSIYSLYRRGNQSAWHCPCPHCGEYQELRFFTYKKGPYAGKGGVAGYTDADGNLSSADDARKNGHYVCIKGCKIENHQKQAMIEKGVWVAKGQKVGKKGKPIGKPEQSRNHCSYHLWTVHVPMINFGALAAAYVDHYSENNMAEFFQNWLGLRYSHGRKVPSWDKVGARLAGYHNRSEVPLKVYFLTAGIDVQLSGVYWGVYGWGHQSRCWVIDWGYHRRFISDADEYSDDDVDDLSFSNVASDLEQLKASLINRRFPMWQQRKSPYDQTSMKVLGVAIDSNYRTNGVHRFVAQLQNPRILTVRGDHNVAPKDRYRRTQVDKLANGQTTAVDVWGIATTYYKQEIYDRLNLEAGVDHSITFPHEMARKGSDFLRQLLNEQFVDEKNEKTGKTKSFWKEKNNRIGSHYLDTLVYAFARAEIQLAQLGATWDANTWTQQRQVNQPKQEIARTYQQ